MDTIGTTKTARFENYLIIGLDGKWEKLFGELPEFDAKLDKKGKLHLVSTKSIPNYTAKS